MNNRLGEGAYWTGGYARLAALYDIVADVLQQKTGGLSKVASSGMYFAEWMPSVVSKVQVLDLHAYLGVNGSYPDANTIVSNVAAWLTRWHNAGLPDTVPFFLGETGYRLDDYSGRTINTAEAAALRAAHLTLQQTYGARYLGMANHSPSFTTSLPWWDDNYTYTS